MDGDGIEKLLPLQKLKKYRYPALVLVLGVFLLLIPVGKRADAEDVIPPASPEAEAFDLAAFTRQTETLLSQCRGAGEVHLLLTLDTEGRRDYLLEQRQETGMDREILETQAVLASQSGIQSPVTLEIQMPRFRGAVVLCPGGDSPEVVLGIKEALSSLTGLGLDRITVLRSG